MAMEQITLDGEPVKEKKGRKSYTREYKLYIKGCGQVL